MSETVKGNSGERYRPECEEGGNSGIAASMPEDEKTSTRTSRKSNSGLPFPFDSESSLGQENGSNGTYDIRAESLFSVLITV